MEYLLAVYLSNLNVKCSLGGFFSIGKNEKWQYDMNTYLKNKFYFILEGSCVINIEGKEYLGTAGTWFFIPAKIRHSYYSNQDAPFKKLWLHFDLETGSGALADILNLPFCINVGINKKIIGLFNEIFRFESETYVTSSFMQMARVCELISEYISGSQSDKIVLSSKNDVCIQSILQYINDNLCQKISNTQLAQLAHMHPNHFIRFFKSKTGLSPIKYLNMRRMKYAKTLLESTDMSLNEITQMVGLVDSSHFSKLFRSFYDVSPNHYKKLFLNQQTNFSLNK